MVASETYGGVHAGTEVRFDINGVDLSRHVQDVMLAGHWDHVPSAQEAHEKAKADWLNANNYSYRFVDGRETLCDRFTGEPIPVDAYGQHLRPGYMLPGSGLTESSGSAYLAEALTSASRKLGDDLKRVKRVLRKALKP